MVPYSVMSPQHTTHTRPPQWVGQLERAIVLASKGPATQREEEEEDDDDDDDED